MVDGLNAVDKRYTYQLMSTVQIPGLIRFDSQIKIHTGNQKYDVSLAKKFQHHLTKQHRENGVLSQVQYKNDSWKENGHTDSIIFRIMLMFHTNI